MANSEVMLKWMADRQGKVTYSMSSRLGPHSYDCSSSVYFALQAGGYLPSGTMGNTDTLFTHLEAQGWHKVAINAQGFYDCKRGDIFIWGARGASGGASGHAGIFVDSQDNIIHCNYGHNGITVNNHDTIWDYNGQPAITIYRYAGAQSSENNIKIELGKTGMFIYWKLRSNTDSVRDAYGVWGNKRFHLDTMTKVNHFKNIVKGATGRDCMEWKSWAYNDQTVKTVESFTELQKTIV